MPFCVQAQNLANTDTHDTLYPDSTCRDVLYKGNILQTLSDNTD